MSINESLLKIERHDQIRALVQNQGRVTVPELSGLFGVSEATVRRDLEELDKLGRIRRTHGGAVRPEIAPKEPPMMQRMGEKPDEKARIGKAALQFIKDGETIFLGSGTTVIEIARNLPTAINLTVITNSLTVVNELATHPGIKLIIIGGMLRDSELSFIGHIAEQALAEVHADKVIIGTRAISLEQGLTNDYLPETMTDRAILNAGRENIIVADHTKCGVVSTAFLAPIAAMHILVTDDKTDSEFIESLRTQGVDVIVV